MRDFELLMTKDLSGEISTNGSSLDTREHLQLVFNLRSLTLPGSRFRQTVGIKAVLNVDHSQFGMIHRYQAETSSYLKYRAPGRQGSCDVVGLHCHTFLRSTLRLTQTIFLPHTSTV